MFFKMFCLFGIYSFAFTYQISAKAVGGQPQVTNTSLASSILSTMVQRVGSKPQEMISSHSISIQDVSATDASNFKGQRIAVVCPTTQRFGLVPNEGVHFSVGVIKEVKAESVVLELASGEHVTFPTVNNTQCSFVVPENPQSLQEFLRHLYAGLREKFDPDTDNLVKKPTALPMVFPKDFANTALFNLETSFKENQTYRYESRDVDDILSKIYLGYNFPAYSWFYANHVVDLEPPSTTESRLEFLKDKPFSQLILYTKRVMEPSRFALMVYSTLEKGSSFVVVVSPREDIDFPTDFVYAYVGPAKALIETNSVLVGNATLPLKNISKIVPYDGSNEAQARLLEVLSKNLLDTKYSIEFSFNSHNKNLAQIVDLESLDINKKEESFYCIFPKIQMANMIDAYKIPCNEDVYTSYDFVRDWQGPYFPEENIGKMGILIANKILYFTMVTKITFEKIQEFNDSEKQHYLHLNTVDSNGKTILIPTKSFQEFRVLVPGVLNNGS